MEISGLKVLVTGATGFIGQALVQRYCNEGVYVRALSRSAEEQKGSFHPSVDVINGDIMNPKDMNRAVKDINVVIHCAATIRGFHSTAELFSSIVDGTNNILEATKDTEITRFVYISSTAVYGTDVYGLITEDTPLYCQKFLYGEAKIKAEKLVCQFHRDYGMPTVILRPTHVYGPASTFWTERLSQSIKKRGVSNS